jgi:hypothetical protein
LDSVNLQSNLNKLVIWSKQNCLPFNINKCSIIIFTRLNNPILFNYSIDHKLLIRVNYIRDLGILIDANLSYSSRKNLVTNKAFKMLGFIYRNTKNFKKINSMKILYFSLVRSHLEFGSMFWSPNYALYINQIENVQYKFLKLICNKLNLPIERDLYHLQGHIIYFSSRFIPLIIVSLHSFPEYSLWQTVLVIRSIYFFMSRHVFKQNVYVVLSSYKILLYHLFFSLNLIIMLLYY